MTRCFSCMNEYDENLEMCPHCGYRFGDEEIMEEHLVPGTYIANGRYMIGKVLGFGGFGVTYVGFDTLMEKKVAIKEYLPGEFSTRTVHQSQIKVYGGDKSEQFNLGMSKFVDEARKLAKMDIEDGVVDVYDAFRDNGTAYIIMELLVGKTLKTYLAAKGTLSVEETEKILLPVFKSLQQVHNTGVIHRDIAPDNIFLSDDGKVKLLDFGAARFASATHSRSLTVIYKPGYSPEEQYESHGNQGPWTDVYALAATFYKCITGITPNTSLERRINDKLKKPSSLGIKISKNKEIALLNALNISAEKRTQSADQFLDEYNSEGKVKRVIEKFAKLDIGRLSLKAKIGIAAASIAIVLLAGAVAILNPFKALTKDDVEVPDGQTRVPMFVNETLDSAKNMADEANIVLQQSDVVYSREIPKGRILFQSVNEGSFIAIESIVEYVTSGGIKQIYVPDGSGLTEEDTRLVLKSNGFQYISVEYEYSDDVASGNTINLRLTQGGLTVEMGTNVDEGTAIIIVVSKGIDPSKIDNTVRFTVGNYVGKTLEEVQKELSGYAGIYVDASEQRYTGNDDAGVILEQKTAAGTVLSAGDEGNDTVHLVISKGIDYRRIPDIVIGRKYKDVIKELEEAGFTVGEIKKVYSGDMAEDCVVSFTDETGETLKEGLQLPAGTKIILVVNDAALGHVEKAGLYDVYGNLTYSWDALVSKGYLQVEKDEIKKADTGLSEILVIPDSIGGISERAFEECRELTSIMIPDSVTNIGDYAFFHCSGLISITLPSGITRIGWRLFEECRSLTSVTIPNGVTYIDYQAFYGCSSLKTVIIPKSVTYIQERVFEGTEWLYDQKLKNPLVIVNDILIDGTEMSGDVTIPNGVTIICGSAFSGCKGLTSVTIPNSVKEIGDFAFYECSNLTSITIPEGVTFIGWEAFSDCSNLKSVTILNSNNLEYVGRYAFSGTKWFSDQQAKNPLVIVNDVLVDGTKASGEVIIPKGVKVIESTAFFGCSGLTSITIPEDVTSITYNAFEDCSNLAEIKVKKGSYAEAWTNGREFSSKVVYY